VTPWRTLAHCAGLVAVALAPICALAAPKPQRGAMPEILVVHRPWPPLVSVRVFVGGGSALDPPGREGQTLLGWTSALRGTEKKTRPQWQAALDAIGAHVEVAVDKSGATILADAAADQVEALLRLVAEAVLTPRFDADEVAAQRDELLADLQHLADDDGALCDDALGRYLYRGQAAGRPVQGSAASLHAIAAADLPAWHARQVTASNLRIGFAGALDAARAHDLVKATFVGLPNRAAPRPVAVKAVADGRRLLLLDKPRRAQTQLAVALTTAPATARDIAALLVASAVLGGPFTSRISRDVRQLRGWAYHADATLALGAHTSTWAATLGTATTDAPAALELVVQLWEELGRHGATPAEVQFAKNWLLGAHKLSQETAAAELAYQLRGRALGLNLAEIAAIPARIAAVDHKSVQRALKERLRPEHLVAVVVGPARQLRDKLSESLTQFAVQVLEPDGAPERTTGAGRAVTSKPIAVEATPTAAPAEDGEEADPDDVDDGADLEAAP